MKLSPTSRLLALLSALILPSMSQATSTTSHESRVTHHETATFAGGCFWCMQSEIAGTKGVISTVVGYTGGHTPSPTYQTIGTGTTGHREAIQVTYHPAQVTYDQLLAIFWANVDPLDATGQFCDQGDQYKAAIYVASDAEKQAAEASRTALSAKLGQAVVTDILPASTFYPAEEYHQNYHEKNPFQYKLYRTGCGRDGRLQDLKKQLKSDK